MSLFTITFDDDEESSSSSPPVIKNAPAPIPHANRPQPLHPQRQQVQKRPMANRPQIQRNQMIISDSESDSDDIPVVVTMRQPQQSKAQQKTNLVNIDDEYYEYDSYYDDEEINIVSVAKPNKSENINEAESKASSYRRPRGSPKIEGNIPPQRAQRESTKSSSKHENTSHQNDEPEIQISSQNNNQQRNKQNNQQNNEENSQIANQTNHQTNDSSISEPEIQNENQIHPMTMPPTTYKNTLVPYMLTRSSAHSIRGKRTHFQLFQGGAPILHTKIKQSDIAFITPGTETHLSSQDFKAAFLMANHKTSFSLRNKNELGEELMTIKYSPNENMGPRDVSVYFPNLGGGPKSYCNRKAHLTAHNMWIIDLRGRFAMKSIKNCILVDSADEEVMIILKAELNSLSIEARQDISDIAVMAMGLSAFLCKL
ncbi:hypothetical protein TRFO_18474 [Tritrichomonas foetus]|uniref:Tubby C-terminal domain-containing protein n=1 Tax=Tritrichomonas foetus TaxID=1144522 RepID=A0A1J4KKZ6_9EUKA|nr:hypothetical protein TRFO_18474 [Tritrichomonas foetus]|eukprot:OHT11899.1 hypothetical protein TRFO_18474 [Tritrichomonas foetus]